MNDTIVHVTPEIADQFVLFQKHYELFNTLEKKGVFDISFGKVIINIAYSQVQNIVKEEMMWRK